MFPQLFRVLPNLHECFYNSIETRRKCFLFLLENSPKKITKNEENLMALFSIKTSFLYTTQCTRRLNLNFFVFLSSYRNTIINQSARVFSLSYFLILNKDFIRLWKIVFNLRYVLCVNFVLAARKRKHLTKRIWRLFRLVFLVFHEVT